MDIAGSSDIESCPYLYLRELGEPADNRLRVVVEEAVANPSDYPAGGPHSEYRPIESTENCRLFELLWDAYVAYGVRNESLTILDDTESRTGRLLCVYSQSHFLDYVRRATFATDEHPGPVQHISINCLNHVVDVVSVAPPRIHSLRHAAPRTS